MGYYCKKCGFKLKKEVFSKKCPYCGEEGIEKEKNAEEFLKSENGRN